MTIFEDTMEYDFIVIGLSLNRDVLSDTIDIAEEYLLL